MYTPNTKSTKQYKVSLKSANGNTVAFLNFTDQFTKAVIGKSSHDITIDDINGINKGDVVTYLKALIIEVEAIKADEVVDASDY